MSFPLGTHELSTVTINAVVNALATPEVSEFWPPRHRVSRFLSEPAPGATGRVAGRAPTGGPGSHRPHDIDVVVGEVAIRGEDGETFDLSLRHEQAVERVGVVQRQGRHLQGMGVVHR